MRVILPPIHQFWKYWHQEQVAVYNDNQPEQSGVDSGKFHAFIIAKNKRLWVYGHDSLTGGSLKDCCIKSFAGI